MQSALQPAYTVNPGKDFVVKKEGREYFCFAIQTKLVTEKDELCDIVEKYVTPVAQKNDIVFMSEKMVACTQGRAIPMQSIRPGFWAKLLHRFVSKNPGGIGLGMPETMQCAIDECGLPRILLASAAGAAGKLLGVKGWFYHVTGPRAAAIDGPCHWTIPPYNNYVVLAPQSPSAAAAEASRQLGGIPVLVVDVNDLGGKILGSSHNDINEEKLLALLRQNPLGQTDECTPIGILREIRA